MLQINGKTFMNLQEAVQWLLDNNALPFQSSANYVANTEIGMGTIVNPSPAKVRIGSLIFFADSKVSTVTGLTENGFICSDQYNNLVDDIAYVTNVAINASGHLITTLSDGQTIDAGIVKQVSGFSINASQHLIVSFNDGTSTDLGAIFSGNVNISGNLTVTGTVDGDTVTGNEVIEKMSGYSFVPSGSVPAGVTITPVYIGISKTGNKVTLVYAGRIECTSDSFYGVGLGKFIIPASLGVKLFPSQIGIYYFLDVKQVSLYSDYGIDPVVIGGNLSKDSTTELGCGLANTYQKLTPNTSYFFRYEVTLLLSENLAS